MLNKASKLLKFGAIALCFVPNFQVYAENIPSSVLGGSLKIPEELHLPKKDFDKYIEIPKSQHITQVPEEAKKIKFDLKTINIVGNTLFTSDILEEFFKSKIDTEISLETIYKITDEITLFYRNKGYFLATAFLPNQKIKDGILTINIIEGYISEVIFDDPINDNEVITSYIERIKNINPVNMADLESILIRLNDIPGMSFRSVISTQEDSNDGAVVLTLVRNESKPSAAVLINDFGSKSLGKHDVIVNYKKSFIPLHNSSFLAATSVPINKLKYTTIEHSFMTIPDVQFYINASIIRSHPDDNLGSNPIDIDTRTDFLKLGASYKLVRTRNASVEFRAALEVRNNSIDVLNNIQTRDRIRVSRASLVSYYADKWKGNNSIHLIVSQGLKILGSSKVGDPYLSRAAADPEFSKGEFTYGRLQDINDKWSFLTYLSAQASSYSLYTAEEFGYGGQALGRAFDNSQLLGDYGFAASVELKYKLKSYSESGRNNELYAFYDLGKIWNNDIDNPGYVSGSSAGFGIRKYLRNNISLNTGVAFPISLVDPSSTLIASKAPRFFFQFEWKI